MSVIKPSNNPIPFGQSGLVNPIPATTATAGKASFDLGFPPITMVQKSLGGLAPDGKDLNGILNHIDQHTVWQTAGGRYYYDSVFAAAVGGYAVGAVVQADDNSKSYINTSAGNTTNPNTGGAGWVIWNDRALPTDLAAPSGSSLVGHGATTVKLQLDANQAAIAGNTAAIAGNTAAISSGTTVAALTLTALNAITSKPVNSLGYVTNDGIATNNGIYQYNGTVWTKSAYDPVVQTTILQAAFTLTATKNIFNQSLAVNGQYRVYTDGSATVIATGMDFGLQPVTLGQTYTWSLPSGLTAFGTVIQCWTSAGVYLGTHVVQGVNPVAPVPPTGVVFSNTNHTVTFTIPSGSTIGKVAINAAFTTHTTGDFNNCVAALQIELGSVATSYISPAPIQVLNEGNTSTLIARKTDLLSAVTNPPVAAFDPTASRNVFNPALAQDLGYRGYPDGNYTAFTNGMTFGKQAVIAGNTYTWSLPNTLVPMGIVLLCYNTSGVYLGTHVAQGANPVAPTPPTGVVFSDSNHQVTFTIPSGSGIGYVAINSNLAAHSAGDFTAALAAMQLEVGLARTAYQPLGLLQILKDSSIPDSAARKTDLLSAKALGLTARFTATTVAIDGTYAYIRTPWSSTLDLVQQVQYGSVTIGSNNVVNPYASKTIPNNTTVANTISAFASGVGIGSNPDDASPCNYNGTYIGANHGAFFIHSVTVTGHGKTVQDVGSQWNASGLTWTIMKIVNANTLWLLSQNIGGTTWSFNTTSLSSIALTHSSGATHTGSFTPSADVLTGLFPAIRSQVKTILLDGRYSITTAGVYQCEFVDILNTYEICNPVGVLSYVQSLVGSSTQPSFTDTSIASDMRVVNTYRYASNGSISINAQYQSRSVLQWNYVGGTQALPLTYGADTLLQYVPKLLPIVGTSKTWDFTAIEDVSSTTDVVNFLKVSWADANNPPSRMAQIVRVSGTKTVGHVVGYGLQRGYSVPATRKTNLSAGFFNGPTKKMYPYLVDGGAYASSLMPANTVVNSIVYRSLFNPAILPTATVFTWYYDGDDIVVVFDIHSSVTAFQLPLPSWFQGKSATVIDASASFSLLTPIVTNDGLLVTVTGGYGQASIKLR